MKVTDINVPAKGAELLPCLKCKKKKKMQTSEEVIAEEELQINNF